MADWVAIAGSAPAFVRESVVAVIPGATDAHAAVARFDAAALPTTLAEALDRVLGGGSIAAAPAFFVAVRDGQTWRCAVRGSILVRLGTATEILGDSVSSWLEFTVDDDSPLDVEVREVGHVSWLPVGHGATQIGALRRGHAPHTDALSAAEPKAIAPTLRDPGLDTLSAAPFEAASPTRSRYDDLYGDLTVVDGVAVADVIETPATVHEPPHETDTATGFDHSDVAVSAILCAQHHPNPPERGQCWRCSMTLASRAVVRVPRPALGTVALDDGRVIEIDRTVLLGRNPRAERTDAAHLPALISVGSDAPGVSRTHARIFLDGWQVLVEDLGSTFGTTLVGADGATRRLRPGQPELVNGDSVLDLGGGSRVRLLGVP